MNKKILSLVLVLALVLGSFNLAFADTKVSSDVAGTEYEDAVARLSNLAILKGYPDGSFKPANTITRAEFATAVARARGFEAAAQNAKGNTPFTDVTASHWASGYVNVTSGAGLVNGVGNGLFAPEAQITYEQAVTLVVRALGYEEKAKSQGGYPTGHLSVASETGLLDDVKGGVQGTPATRGLVAQLLDNALEIPKMIQTGFGDSAKWVVSGTENTEKKYLYDDLGFDRLEKAVVESADQKKNKVTIKGLDKSEKSKTKTLNVSSDFNFAAYEGLKVTVWFDKDDKLVEIKLDNDYTVKFDAIEVTKSGKDDEKALGGEIKLITEDKKYDITDEKYDEKFVNKNDDKLTKGQKYNFAKIILNESNDITWVEAYDLNEVIVVEKVEKDTIIGYDGEELDELDDYKIIKGEKQIKASELEKKDVVIYNSSDEYAVVLTNTNEGKIERIFKDGFKVNGKTYDYKNDYENARYITGDDLDEVDENVLEEMQDSGDVKVILSFDKKAVLVDGKAEDISSNYVMVEDTTILNTGRVKGHTLDVLNSEGKVVKYDIDEKDINKGDIIKGLTDSSKWTDYIKVGGVVELKLKANGEVKEVIPAKGIEISKSFKTDASHVEGKQLQSKAVVFWKDGENDIEDYTVIRLSAVKNEFDKVEKGTIFYDEDNKIVAIYAEETNNDKNGQEMVAAITKVKELKGSDYKYEVTFEVNGTEFKDYEAKGSKFDDLLKEDTVRVLEVVKDTKQIKNIDIAESLEIKVSSASNKVIKSTDGASYDVSGKYYDSRFETTNAKDAEGEEVTLFFQPGSRDFVQVVVIDKLGNVNPSEARAKLEAQPVISELKALDSGKTGYIASAKTAVEKYNNLSKAAKALVNADSAAKAKLDTAIADIDQEIVDEAQPVIDKLTALDSTEADYITKAKAAVADYNKLSQAAQAKVDEDSTAKAKLNEAISKIEDGAVGEASQAVIDKLTDLDNTETDYITKAKAAVSDYNKLSKAAKDLVNANSAAKAKLNSAIEDIAEADAIVRINKGEGTTADYKLVTGRTLLTSNLEAVNAEMKKHSGNLDADSIKDIVDQIAK